MIVTPDAPLLVASSFVLFSLAKVLQTGRGAWWLAVGAAVGCALLSKYTALFFGPAILIWLVAVPKLRRWLISPWLYLGGLVALLLFAPVILWNADHQWVSFIKQMGRARDRGFPPGLHRRTDPDADCVRDAAGMDPRRDGALRALPASRRRAAGARARQHHVLDHRRVFRLAFAACPRRSQLVCAGLSGVRSRRRGRRPSRPVGAASAAHGRLLPALGGAVGHLDVCRCWSCRPIPACSPAIAATRPCAASASAGAKLADADRGGEGARRRNLRARAGLRHHRLARVLSAEGHLRRAAGPAHPLGQHARA